MSAGRILVVDDEDDIREVAKAALEITAGWRVLLADSGPAAVERAAAERPDAILLDVMMPGMDGWQVAESLVEDEVTSHIPLVFLTARAELRDRAKGLELGGVDYITKPFNPVELASVVENLLDRVRRGERDELRREKIAELRTLLVE